MRAKDTSGYKRPRAENAEYGQYPIAGYAKKGKKPISATTRRRNAGQMNTYPGSSSNWGTGFDKPNTTVRYYG